MTRAIHLEESSGNVFADLGLPNPEERLAKSGLAIRIAAAIRARRLTQAGAARILKIDQPKVGSAHGSNLGSTPASWCIQNVGAGGSCPSHLIPGL